MKMEFLTPVGRLVQGDPFEAQTKNKAGQPLVTKSGQPTQRYFIAVAFPKADPRGEFAAFYQKLVEVARGSFPQLFNAQGQCSHPRFSWKLADGDGVDDDGKPNANKSGFAGHWVIKFSSSFAPKCFHAGRYQPHEQIQDAKAIPRGYYVRVAGTIEGNDDVSKPGLYVNLSMVELAGGQPSDMIVSGPDAATVFGGAPAMLPAGVAAPILPMTAPPGMPGGFPTPGVFPGALPGAAPLPGAGSAAAPSLPNTSGVPGSAGPATTYPSNPTAVAPNPAFLAGPGAAAPAVGPVVGTPAQVPAPAVTAPPAVPSSVPQMTAKAGGATYEQFRANGWDDANMRAQGYML